MDLINWSLSAIDTIFSTRKLGSGEPVCPDGTFAAGYTRDAWERWQIVCLAALSVEDIEDIYLFGTIITGLLLIGLGFALGYRKIQKTGTAVQNLTRLPALTEAVGRAVSIATETINRNMDSIKTINRNMDCILEKITALQRKIYDRDQNGQIEYLLWNAATPLNKSQSYLLAPPYQHCLARSLLEMYPWERTLQRDALVPSPITDITPLPRPNCLWTLCTATCRAGLWPAPQMALDRTAACQSWICFPLLQAVSMVYVLLCWGVFFLFSHCTPNGA